MKPLPPQAKPLPARAHGFVWGILAAISLALLCVTLVRSEQNVWSGWLESREFQRPVYWERIHAREVFRTRANTWSNLAYILVGLYSIAFAWQDLRGQRRGPHIVSIPAMSFGFGAACCCLGIGSGVFHASLTRFGQQLDVAAMYPPLMVMMAVGIGRWIPVVRLGPRSRRTWPALLVLVFIASGLLYFFKWSMSSRLVLNTLVGSVTALTLLARFCPPRGLDGRWLAASAAALAAGVYCRQADIAGRFSGPDAWTQGHALWHVLTAASLGCLYAFYRSERNPGMENPASPGIA
jgi:hypothetical protein